MSLRTGAIEALYPFMDGDYNPDEWAADALDALLDYLEAHADEWEVNLQLPADAPDHFKVSWLIATLRDSP